MGRRAARDGARGLVLRRPRRSSTGTQSCGGGGVLRASGHHRHRRGRLRGRRGGPPASAVSRRIDELTAYLRARLHAFVRDFELDVLVPENALGHPHAPAPGPGHHAARGRDRDAGPRASSRPSLGASALPCERVADILGAAFPPALPNVRHVCINSAQREQIARRLGRSARVIPNVMDFEDAPPLPTRRRASASC